MNTEQEHKEKLVMKTQSFFHLPAVTPQSLIRLLLSEQTLVSLHQTCSVSLYYTTSLIGSLGFIVLRSEVKRAALERCSSVSVSPARAAQQAETLHTGTHEWPVIQQRDFRRVIRPDARRSRLSVCVRDFICHLHKQLSFV